MNIRQLPRIALLLCMLWSVAVPALAERQGDAALNAHIAPLCDRRVVALGELPSHGEGEIHELKADLVRALVEECGFDTLLFEAPIYEFQLLDAGAAPQVGLDNAIGRFWLSENLADWRAWLWQRMRKGELRIGGIDDQISATSTLSRGFLPGLIAASTNRPECGEAVRRYLFWAYSDTHPYNPAERNMLAECAALALGTGTDRAQRIHLRNLERLLSRQAGLLPVESREDSLAANVIEQIMAHEGSKAIIWSANNHVARDSKAGGVTRMGALLARSLGANYAAIGVTALAGETAMPGMTARNLAELPSDALERVGSSQPFPRFLTGSLLQQSNGRPSRVLGPVVAREWSALFDMIVVLDEVRAPRAPTGAAR